MEEIIAIGRRKSAIARTYVSPGKGNITINKRDLKEYFPTPQLQYVVLQPLELLDSKDKYDIKVNLTGGGFNGQAEALRLAISRAMVKNDPDCRMTLKANGLLTRDSRKVERKKPGQPKARKRFQFSKR